MKNKDPNSRNKETGVLSIIQAMGYRPKYADIHAIVCVSQLQ